MPAVSNTEACYSVSGRVRSCHGIHSLLNQLLLLEYFLIIIFCQDHSNERVEEMLSAVTRTSGMSLESKNLHSELPFNSRSKECNYCGGLSGPPSSFGVFKKKK